jgi:hypothetical protein
MPNGTELSHDEFVFLNRALENIDAIVTPFAAELKGGVTSEYHGYPCRRIELREAAGINKMITISPITSGGGASKCEPHYGLVIWVSRDTDEARIWWAEEVARFSLAQMTPIITLPALVRAWEQLKPIGLEFLNANGRVSTFPRIRKSDFGE